MYVRNCTVNRNTPSPYLSAMSSDYKYKWGKQKYKVVNDRESEEAKVPKQSYSLMDMLCFVDGASLCHKFLLSPNYASYVHIVLCVQVLNIQMNVWRFGAEAVCTPTISSLYMFPEWLAEDLDLDQGGGRVHRTIIYFIYIPPFSQGKTTTWFDTSWDSYFPYMHTHNSLGNYCMWSFEVGFK